MRPISIKLMSIIGLAVTLLIFVGCSSSEDLLDTEALRYSLDVESSNVTLTDEINVVRADCDDDPNTDRDGLLFPFDAEVTVSSFQSDSATEDTPPATFVVEGYEFFLNPISGTYFVGGNEFLITRDVMPDLNAAGFTSSTRGRRSVSSPIITPGGSATLDIAIWSAGDKDAYISFLNTLALLTNAGAEGEGTVFSYDLEVVVHCRSNEDDTFTIEGATPVFFGNYVVAGECQTDEE